ncbi:putative FMN-dependent luciferase-like monooxygenase [Rubellimicrobium arenae]|uniref:putative FMN-dependent luciferase-like monooxygenase n=1 Tax=Rubellimicrobium arenae TaxID=2817372 RepID=UPI001B316F46|nr:putative FMN-dependent luciferase-like monooxygenase [Rubellimicrobium arenae]
MTSKRIGFFSRLLDDAPPGERYRMGVEQVLRAEALGFDSFWIAQHHFDGTEGGMPSPLLFLSHLAARTSWIRLGTGIVTLPMEQPLRVAEDAAVLDALSNGRLEIGLGSGGTPTSFAAFGLDHGARSEVFDRHLAVLRSAWAGKDVGGGNLLYPAAPGLNDRVWQATFSVRGGERAGRDGDGLLLSRTQPRPPGEPLLPLHEIQLPIVDAYHAALPPGRAPRILASRSVFVADSRADARTFAEAGLRRIAERFRRAGHELPGTSIDDLIRAFDTHCGTPDEVAESLSRDATLAHATDVAVQVHSVDPPHRFILRSLELFAQQVAPALGWTALPARPRMAALRP